MDNKKPIFPASSIPRAGDMKATAWREINRGKLLGVFTLQLPSRMLLVDCPVFQKDTGEQWVGFPAKSYQTADGKTQYTNVIDFVSQTVAARFKRAAFEAVTRYLSERSPSTLRESGDESDNDDRALTGDEDHYL